MKPLFVIGRMIFGGFFLYSGIGHFLNREAIVKEADAKGVFASDAAVLGTGALLVLGGASLLTGIKTPVGAGAIVSFLSGVTPVMHDFWNHSDEKAQNEMIHFSKNVALLGAALSLAGARVPRN